jgi:hypothetical protein
MLQDNDGWTALHWCAYHRKIAPLTILLEIAAERDEVAAVCGVLGNEGESALSLAVDSSDEVATMLRKAWGGWDSIPAPVEATEDVEEEVDVGDVD